MATFVRCWWWTINKKCKAKYKKYINIKIYKYMYIMYTRTARQLTTACHKSHQSFWAKGASGGFGTGIQEASPVAETASHIGIGGAFQEGSWHGWLASSPFPRLLPLHPSLLIWIIRHRHQLGSPAQPCPALPCGSWLLNMADPEFQSRRRRRANRFIMLTRRCSKVWKSWRRDWVGKNWVGLFKWKFGPSSKWSVSVSKIEVLVH